MGLDWSIPLPFSGWDNWENVWRKSNFFLVAGILKHQKWDWFTKTESLYQFDCQFDGN